MAGYTRVGDITRWLRLRDLSCETRWLWLALFTDSSRVIPGLWRGGIGAMSDLANFDRHQTVRCLDQLLEHDLIEYDATHGVLRLTELPDAWEWPMNGSTLIAWWRRFLDVPACPVRDAHLKLVWWLIETATRDSTLRAGRKNEISADIRETWEETFGQIPMPTKRRQGVKRLLDEDTSTPVQPSLFAASPVPTPVQSIVSATSPNTTELLVRHGVDHPGERERDSSPDLGSGSSLSPDSGEQVLDQIPEHTPPPGPPPTPVRVATVIPMAESEFAIRRKMGDEIWDSLNGRRNALAMELGLDPPRVLHDQLPGRRALAERLRESGDHARDDADHVLAICEAEARASGSMQWFAGCMFEPKSWAFKLALTLADAVQNGKRVRDRQQSANEVVGEVFADLARQEQLELHRGDTS